MACALNDDGMWCDEMDRQTDAMPWDGVIDTCHSNCSYGFLVRHVQIKCITSHCMHPTALVILQCLKWIEVRLRSPSIARCRFHFQFHCQPPWQHTASYCHIAMCRAWFPLDDCDILNYDYSAIRPSVNYRSQQCNATVSTEVRLDWHHITIARHGMQLHDEWSLLCSAILPLSPTLSLPQLSSLLTDLDDAEETCERERTPM